MQNYMWNNGYTFCAYGKFPCGAMDSYNIIRKLIGSEKNAKCI